MRDIKNENYILLSSLFDYLKQRPDDIYKALVDNVKASGVSEEYAYATLLNSFLGLDDEFINRYLVSMIVKDTTDKYLNNPFYQKMTIQPVDEGNLAIDYSYIEEYELFMQDEVDEYLDGRLFAQVGYFDDFLKCLTIYEKEIVLAKFSPLIVNASISPLDEVSGKVACLGLEIGYFVYMAHLKDDVKSIVVYEQNKELINLFKKHILPKFDYPEKIKILNKDPLDILRAQSNKLNVDYIYVNMWNNIEDGVKEYPKYKKLEVTKSKTKYLYYLEQSINLYPKEENNANNWFLT